MRPRLWLGIWLLAILIFGVTTSAASDPPQIVEKPKDLKVRVGSTATFYCRVTGDPPPQVHWRKNGKKVSTAHSRIVINNYGGYAMLRIEPIRHQRDDASYECMAENGVGDPVVASANLTVFAENEVPEGFPVIINPPTTKVVEKGRTASLTCEATGKPPLNIVWLKDLLPFPASDRFTFVGQNGEMLQITDAGEADAGSYDCIVENPVGTESSTQSAKVYVKERRVPPEFTLPPDPLYEVMLGADLNLTCVAVGSPMPTVQWRRGIESLTPDDAIPIGKNILTLKNIRETAVYTCIATSKLGIKEINSTVKVQSLPKPPSKVRVSDVTATSVRLNWSYDADETEDVTYYVIQYKPKFSTQDFAEISGVLNQDHMITSLNPYTEYEFSVIAFNKVGRGTPSAPVEATTGETTDSFGSAKPKSAPREVNARPLSSSQMLVKWLEPETPNGQITGYKVYFTTNPTLPLAQWDAKKVESNDMTNIHDLIPRTIYTIRVQAYTAIGPGPVSAPIQAKTEQGVPGQPRNFRSTSVSPTSAVLEWTKPNHIGNNIVGYELYWNDTFSKERNHRSVPVGESFTLNGLYPNTMYFMWLAAKSLKGEGATTPPIPVRTEQYTPGAPPQKFHGESEDSTSIRITWAPPPEDKQHGDIKYYKIFFVENDLSDVDASQVTITDPNAREFIIDQLRKWTDYRIWILAGTSVGDGPHTTHILIRTDEDVPGEPQNVSVSAVNSTTILIRWESPNQNEKHGVIRGYQIHVQELSEDGDSLLNLPLRYDVLDGMARNYTVLDLQPDTKYSVQVAALTRKGDGLRSKKVILKTPGGVPSRPDLTLKVFELNTSVTVDLEWTKPALTFGDLKGYRLKYGPKNIPPEEIIFEGVEIRRHRLQKLERGVEYEFKLAASNHIGYGQEAMKLYTTPEGIPSGPPINISIRFQASDVVAVSWLPPVPEERNGQILRYHVLFQRKIGDRDSVERNVTSPKAVFTNLEENQEYWVQVCGATSQGRGPYSERFSFKTDREMLRAPTNVVAMATSDSTVEVWWDGVPARGRLVGYQIFYTTTATEDLDTWQSISVPVTNSADLINVEKNTFYSIIVCAKSKQGLGRVSEMVTVKVKPEEVPLQLTAADLSTHSMTLKWARPVRLNPLEYKISYDAIKEFVDSDGMTQSQYFKIKELRVSPERTSQVIEELSPFTTYNVNLTAVPSDNSYRPPAKITVTTHMAAPQPMVKPDACFLGGKISLFLPQASEEYGPVSHYYLIVVPDTKKMSSKIPDQFLTDNMASLNGASTKVTIVGSTYANEEDGEDDESSNVNLIPYIAARFLPRAIPRNFQLGDGDKYNSFENKPLEKNYRYKVFLRAIVDTPQKHLYTSSPFSDPISLHMPEAQNCEPPVRAPADTTRNPHGPTVTTTPQDHGMLWVVAPVIAVVLAACCMLMCFLFKRRRVTHKHLDQSGVMKPLMATERQDLPTGYITSSLGIHTMGSDGLPCPDGPTDPVEMRRINFKSAVMMQHPPVPIADLGGHIDRLKANDNHLFSQEYESIDPGQQFTWDASNMEFNKPKNRYANVVAYDHSRVVLQPIDGISGSDYINANYCDGYRRQNAYIATQGPLPETFADFWRMCWEVNTATVVMMTRLEERTRIKCDQYWPSRGSETYGDITVTLREVQELSTYCIRSFLVRRTAPGMQQTREIKQLQFTAWPDHGVPDHPAPFLMFLRRVKTLNPPDCGPMIVHCSAGVGRTGCFVVIDSMLERMQYDNCVDIYGHVTCLRAQRNYMVQTEDQYIFIHDAILEAVICGNTEVPADKLQLHLELLTALHPGETYTGLDIEFKKLSNMKIDPNRFLSANLPVNQKKNRLVNILPFESTRVCLQPIRGVEGSDYINASFIDGYKDRSSYIATQGPLAETIDDFWRMLWEHNSTIIVMLTKLREMGKEKCYHYWPNDRSQRYQCFVVDPIAEYNLSQYTLREFKITDARDGQSRTIRQFQFAEWPEQGVPKSAEGFIDFIGQVHKTKEQFGQEGPITVHCSAGVGRTGVFIALSVVLARIQSEDVVDLFQTVRILRTQRPAMVQSEDQYEFCYRAALEYLAYDQYT